MPGILTAILFMFPDGFYPPHESKISLHFGIKSFLNIRIGFSTWPGEVIDVLYDSPFKSALVGKNK